MRDWEGLLRSIGAVRLEGGATDDEIAAAEKRLGVALPPDYRAFLQAANGFGPLDDSVRRLRPVSELQWLRDEDPELVRIWSEASGDDSLAATLVVSDEEDGARVLLNPAVVSEDGEWEAWFFAHWVPGAEAFPSFRALLETLHQRHVREERATRGEPTPQVAPQLGVAADDLDGLVAALRRPDPADRVAALEALGNLRNTGAVDAVADRLRDEQEDDYVRATAARTLGELRDERAVAALIDVLRRPYPQGRVFDRRSPEQEAAIGVIHAARQGLLGLGSVALPALAAALTDSSAQLRAEACTTLCYARDRPAEALELMSSLVADPDPEVRLALVTNVDQLFHERCRDVAEALLEDSDERVRVAARRTLERLRESGL
jgi:hypothetical protein